MSENDIKFLLKSLKKLRAKREVLRCLNKENSYYQNICKIIYIMESSLDILKESEKEIIQMHLVDGFTWEQVVIQFEKQHGKQNGYSRRTYERMQQKALKQILGIVKNNEIDNLITYIMYND